MCKRVKASGVIGEGSDSFPIVEEFEAKKREIRCAVYCKLLKLTLLSLFFPMHLQHSSLRSTSSLVSSRITISSANSIVHGGSLLTSSVSLSIITANRNGLKADPWCSPTLTLKLSAVLTAHLTTVSLPSYISCTSRTHFFTVPGFPGEIAC